MIGPVVGDVSPDVGRSAIGVGLSFMREMRMKRDLQQAIEHGIKAARFGVDGTGSDRSGEIGENPERTPTRALQPSYRVAPDGVYNSGGLSTSC